MSALIALLTTLNSLSPLAVIALLILVVFYQLKGHKQVDAIRSNDLHNLEDMAQALQRIEVSMEKNFGIILAKLNGGS